MNLTFLLLFAFSPSVLAAQPPNTLTAAERRDGWRLLFDGRTTTGWRAAYGDAFPTQGWVIGAGELRAQAGNGAEAGQGGDIVTTEKFRNFELAFDWKIGPNGNSGVKYFVEERLPKPQGSQPGYEYQLIDDANYRLNGQPLPPRLKTASIYDVLPADKPDVSVDDWHQSRIVVRGNRIEHWLDGAKVLDVDRTSETFRRGVADSKFKDYPGFTTIPEGRILLQDHGHSVAFRNLKIKPL